MMRKIGFTVPGVPVAKGRPRFTAAGGYPRTYTPAKTENYENLIRLAFTNKYPFHVPIDAPIMLSVVAFFPIPQSYSKKKQEMARNGQLLMMRKPDADNVLKAVLDGLNKVAWADDARIWSIDMTKHYNDTPYLSVTISWEDGEKDE